MKPIHVLLLRLRFCFRIQRIYTKGIFAMEIASKISTTTETSYTNSPYMSLDADPLFEMVARGNLRKLQSTLIPELGKILG